MDDGDYDYDDPRFLAVQDTVLPTSYADKRRRTLQRGLDQQRQPPSSRKADERSKRDEGLRTSILNDDSKAARMMKSMGFTPGQGLGSSTAKDARVEPLGFDLRQGRTGLGVLPPPSKRPRFTPSATELATAAALPIPSTSDYQARNRSELSDRKAYGTLRSVRRTCEELDRRVDIVDSYRWRELEDPVALARKERSRRAFLRGDADPDEDLGVDVRDARQALDRKDGLDYERGLSGIVVDQGEDDEADSALVEEAKRDEDEWFAQDVQTRLALTLTYLRETYSYCFYCGCQYESAEDMAGSCPGEEEDMH